MKKGRGKKNNKQKALPTKSKMNRQTKLRLSYWRSLARAADTQPDYFSFCPDEILLYILSMLNSNDVCSMACTCPRIHRISKDKRLWMPRLETEFPDNALCRWWNPNSSSPPDDAWYKLYKSCWQKRAKEEKRQYEMDRALIEYQERVRLQKKQNAQEAWNKFSTEFWNLFLCNFLWFFVYCFVECCFIGFLWHYVPSIPFLAFAHAFTLAFQATYQNLVQKHRILGIPTVGATTLRFSAFTKRHKRMFFWTLVMQAIVALAAASMGLFAGTHITWVLDPQFFFSELGAPVLRFVNEYGKDTNTNFNFNYNYNFIWEILKKLYSGHLFWIGTIASLGTISVLISTCLEVLWGILKSFFNAEFILAGVMVITHTTFSYLTFPKSGAGLPLLSMIIGFYMAAKTIMKQVIKKRRQSQVNVVVTSALPITFTSSFISSTSTSTSSSSSQSRNNNNMTTSTSTTSTTSTRRNNLFHTTFFVAGLLQLSLWTLASLVICLSTIGTIDFVRRLSENIAFNLFTGTSFPMGHFLAITILHLELAFIGGTLGLVSRLVFSTKPITLAAFQSINIVHAFRKLDRAFWFGMLYALTHTTLLAGPDVLQIVLVKKGAHLEAGFAFAFFLAFYPLSLCLTIFGLVADLQLRFQWLAFNNISALCAQLRSMCFLSLVLATAGCVNWLWDNAYLLWDLLISAPALVFSNWNGGGHGEGWELLEQKILDLPVPFAGIGSVYSGLFLLFWVREALHGFPI
jgi:hypothetical protein